MKININRLDKKIPLPEYKTHGSIGFDLYVREETKVPAKNFARVNLNVVVETPPGYLLMIASRSSTIKKGLMPANGMGIVDQDYRGPNDEVCFIFYNFTDQDIIINPGDRIAQGIFIRADQAELVEIDEISNADRGGWGSTGA